MTVAIVDYGICNVDSVSRAVEECGGVPLITRRPEDLEHAAAIILPGVGAFPDAMENLRAWGLADAIREQTLENGIPMLGICLGMQLLADAGEEHHPTQGLGLIPGRVQRLEPDAATTRVPHMGWNEVEPVNGAALLDGVEPRKDFYFVHSYHFVPAHEDDVVARTPYCGGFVSAVGRGSVVGTQFHPEKSQKVGFRLLRNFLGT